METITVSPKFQVVIPKEIRTKLKIKPGQKLQVFNSGNRIEYVIVRDIRDSRGFLKAWIQTLKEMVTDIESRGFIWMAGIFYKWSKFR